MATVLIVDDSAVDRRLAQGVLEKNLDLSFMYAVDGADALEQIKISPPDLVLTDLQMPVMSGLELVRHVRDKYPLIPVILMTAQGSEEIAVQALASGAASYVPKSRLARELASTVETVLSTSRAHRHHARMMECVTRNHWTFVLDNDPSLIPAIVDHLQQHITRLKLCDETGRIRVAIALEEALLNALYHGNFELSSDLREQDAKRYYALAEERRREEPYRSRTIHFEADLSAQQMSYLVRDGGPGFDPGAVPDPTDPANLERSSGRGLLLIRTFMDEVRHNDKGNEIVMVKHRDR
ncbi:MAG TPA: response regulator [Pirellulales bacterium]|nr:response regulator [Pirellulales bacterium]